MVKLPEEVNRPDPSMSKLPERVKFVIVSDAIVNLGRSGLYKRTKTPTAAATAAARMKKVMRDHKKQQQKEKRERFGGVWVMRFLGLY